VKKLILLCSAAAVMPTAAFAQSTGSQDFEEEAIIITGSRTQEVGGVQAPDTPKAKAVLTQEFISRQNPGQTILDTINAVPGVSFTNNDAYGSSGGTLTIRGFSSDRISLTFDGIPLNDSGNYAIYSNQQLDPELIEQVNVNLGSTDVDSPTAAAVGGTVNYRTRNPSKELGGRVVFSLGEYDFRRIFASFDTGEVGPWGTRAWISASTAKNDNPFNNYGKVDKQQYNAKIYQPIGTNGDFVSVSGHYNQNRNNFFGSVRLDDRFATPNGFPSEADEREYDINYPCTVREARPGLADNGNANTDCGGEFDRRYNPSNTGNIRINSRFTLTDQLILTVDPSYQYVKANGGGTVLAREYGYDIFDENGSASGGRDNCSTTVGVNVICVPGYFGGSPYFGGVDLNGDGDLLDSVVTIAPSQTRTHRFGVIAGLRYRFNDDHSVRVSYTWDHANHRQTGEVGLLDSSGEPLDVFPVNDPGVTPAGNPLQKRDRQSYAILNQIAAEYVGSFFDDALTVNVGARLPFFKRDLENFCYTSSASGFVECAGGDADVNDDIGFYNPGYSVPQRRVFKYNKLLPNIGFVYDFTPQISAFASYTKNLSVPGTDNLYNSFFFAEGTEGADPDPELTDTFDGGVRYRSGKIQAQLGLWHTVFTDRLASSYDPDLNASVYRNLGKVTKYGIDGSIAYAPIPALTFYAFGSLAESKIKDNIQVGGAPGYNCDNISTPTVTDLRNCAFTAGKYEAGAAKWSYGLSAVAKIGDLDVGFTAKRTGPRYIFDNNEPVQFGDVDCVGVTPAAGTACPISSSSVAPFEIFSSKTPAYWLVNLDLRYNLKKLIGLEKSYIGFNVYNLFNETYVGSFTASGNQTLSSAGVYASAPFAQIGAPRTVSGTLSIEF
jgi:iron complex outermembrane receptor protein